MRFLFAWLRRRLFGTYYVYMEALGCGRVYLARVKVNQFGTKHVTFDFTTRSAILKPGGNTESGSYRWKPALLTRAEAEAAAVLKGLEDPWVTSTGGGFAE